MQNVKCKRQNVELRGSVFRGFPVQAPADETYLSRKRKEVRGNRQWATNYRRA
jgi:hypothetical protein